MNINWLSRFAVVVTTEIKSIFMDIKVCSAKFIASNLTSQYKLLLISLLTYSIALVDTEHIAELSIADFLSVSIEENGCVLNGLIVNMFFVYYGYSN